MYLAAHGIDLSTLPLDEQFVITSLVYNSGILFPCERILQVLSFDTARYLYEVNQKNVGKRPVLPLFAPTRAEQKLRQGLPYPTQLTSWNAVYHILQRYGAWAAMTRFTNIFDAQGEFGNSSPPSQDMQITPAK